MQLSVYIRHRINEVERVINNLVRCYATFGNWSTAVCTCKISLGPRRSGGGANGGGGADGRAPGIHCMRMREQRWNSTAAVLFLVMIVHVINIHNVDSSQ